MKTIIKFISVMTLSAAFMICFVMPVSASEKDISAYASEPTVSADTVTVSQECYLYGSAACTDSGLLGNPCQWKARQYGDLAAAGTGTSASFGEGTSYTNIMSKTKMVIGSVAQTYEKKVGMPHHYTQANTRLYY